MTASRCTAWRRGPHRDEPGQAGRGRGRHAFGDLLHSDEVQPAEEVELSLREEVVRGRCRAFPTTSGRARAALRDQRGAGAAHARSGRAAARHVAQQGPAARGGRVSPASPARARSSRCKKPGSLYRDAYRRSAARLAAAALLRCRTCAHRARPRRRAPSDARRDCRRHGRRPRRRREMKNVSGRLVTPYASATRPEPSRTIGNVRSYWRAKRSASSAGSSTLTPTNATPRRPQRCHVVWIRRASERHGPHSEDHMWSTAGHPATIREASESPATASERAALRARRRALVDDLQREPGRLRGLPPVQLVTGVSSSDRPWGWAGRPGMPVGPVPGRARGPGPT